MIYWNNSQKSAYGRTEHKFITVERYKICKISKGKGPWNKVQRKPGADLQVLFSSGVTPDVFISSSHYVLLPGMVR